MNLTTLSIESVHGVKQLLTLENFTVGPVPQTESPNAPKSTAVPAPTQTKIASENGATQQR